ncbi:cobalamin biosynthesis protein [Streptosporangium nondiastaticum]|uniref:cobalamin biosynthesis protein n=1 Tax=Streptosporangium nondiastaticum TaxID=35764 RepID=UPI001CB8C1AF|nr:cobalamin biosynthesis protein [Streptosporangium nondiastaticum]
MAAVSVAVYVGVGARRGVPAAEVLELIERALTEAGAAGLRPAALVTVEAKASEAGLLEAAARLGVPLRSYGADALSRVAVPASSAAVLAAVGTPAVAEAAALLAAGPGGVLAVRKRKSARATCAVAYGPA